ncbi:MAG: RNA pseudouridine synthase [Bacteroidia bacterium]|jgi:23S rRNA pseudouridine1911/1915/1917 synthase|nr:RNA pseudouridine synthase [Bacteroidia bacterium]
MALQINTNSIWEEQIVYEDNHILIINKMPSELVQGDKTGDMPLSEKIKNYLKIRENKPGNVFCGVIHRLDRPVSGLVIFAKTSKALSRFNELFREKDIQKSYLAVIKNKPPKEKDTLVHYLLKNEKTNTSKAFLKPVTHALKASLDYELMASADNYHLLKINLHTGRHHQIRAQLSAIGCPIKGDLKYGFPRTNDGGFIHLHSFGIAFVHPIKKEPINIQAWPITNDAVWNYFKDKFSEAH